MKVYAIEHVQLAMPPNGEEAARSFYIGVLGLTEKPKPSRLAARGGVWFEQGELKVHLGVEPDFRPAKKAHPALLVEGLDELIRQCEQAGVPVVWDEPLDGFRRAYVNDPFGNRIELMEPMTDQSERLNVERIEHPLQLAHLRGVTLDEVMQQLGVKSRLWHRNKTKQKNSKFLFRPSNPTAASAGKISGPKPGSRWSKRKARCVWLALTWIICSFSLQATRR